MSLVFRNVELSESDWLNDVYQRNEFVPSDLSVEKVLVAEIDHEPVALGRLVPVGDGAFELGGMLVFEGHRGKGFAKEMVRRLIQLAEGAPLFCVPFKPVSALYRNLGFVDSPVTPDLPAKLVSKFQFCAGRYDQGVLLFRYQPQSL